MCVLERVAVAGAVCRYPTSEWTLIGELRASDVRTVQAFPLTETVYAKYIKVCARNVYVCTYVCMYIRMYICVYCIRCSVCA